ncbi:MAG: metallophosphoesterase [Planctomycetota bacterium]
MDRRTFLKHAARGTAHALVIGTAYSLFEAKWAHVVNERIEFPGLPDAFRGLRIALLTDLHHGPWTGLSYIHDVVRQADEQKADLILLGGDYCHNGPEYIEPCIAALGDLSAPLGVFSVMGNHDHYQGTQVTRNSFAKHNIRELTNEGVWLKRDGQRLRLGGVDDLITGSPRLPPVLTDMKVDERCLLLSHNPDFIERIHDPRVGLMLSGHTHGGQVDFPLIGAPVVHSPKEKDYLHGLFKTINSQVYVSRGLGTTTPPVRFCCRPEINMIELV